MDELHIPFEYFDEPLPRTDAAVAAALRVVTKIQESVDERTQMEIAVLYAQGFFTRNGDEIIAEDPLSEHRLHSRNIAQRVFHTRNLEWIKPDKQPTISAIGRLVNAAMPRELYESIAEQRGVRTNTRLKKGPRPSQEELSAMFREFYESAARRISNLRDEDVDFRGTESFFSYVPEYVAESLKGWSIRRIIDLTDMEEDLLYPVSEDKVIVTNVASRTSQPFKAGFVRHNKQSGKASVGTKNQPVDILLVRYDEGSSTTLTAERLDVVSNPRQLVLLNSGVFELLK